MDLDLPYQIKVKHFIPYVKHIYGITDPPEWGEVNWENYVYSLA